MKRRVIPVVLILLAMVGLLGWRIWQQRAELNGPAGGSGVIEGRELRLSSRVGGRIEEIMVKEGQQVAAGAIVLRLDCIEPKAALAEADAR
ncbi:MAG: biotin/lipoyl-binding protein, partial [Oligoflexia bacterium]|nr:biotin/lipoyl-binding protein [Oligoflexia bacterium]